jgi:hypothetical protein
VIDPAAGDLSGLREQAGRAGIGLEVIPVPGGARVSWQIPLIQPAAPA